MNQDVPHEFALGIHGEGELRLPSSVLDHFARWQKTLNYADQALETRSTTLVADVSLSASSLLVPRKRMIRMAFRRR